MSRLYLGLPIVIGLTFAVGVLPVYGSTCRDALSGKKPIVLDLELRKTAQYEQVRKSLTTVYTNVIVKNPRPQDQDYGVLAQKANQLWVKHEAIARLVVLSNPELLRTLVATLEPVMIGSSPSEMLQRRPDVQFRFQQAKEIFQRIETAVEIAKADPQTAKQFTESIELFERQRDLVLE